eukprot:GHVL01027315.1.p1 GENE.GHVL01027315.1~~GHVL01027315.1.p1  ORF type:complete len:611 (+),score=126.32 GHVL01027315.1:79-1911(+)
MIKFFHQFFRFCDCKAHTPPDESDVLEVPKQNKTSELTKNTTSPATGVASPKKSRSVSATQKSPDVLVNKIDSVPSPIIDSKANEKPTTNIIEPTNQTTPSLDVVKEQHSNQVTDSIEKNPSSGSSIDFPEILELAKEIEEVLKLFSSERVVEAGKLKANVVKKMNNYKSSNKFKNDREFMNELTKLQKQMVSGRAEHLDSIYADILSTLNYFNIDMDKAGRGDEHGPTINRPDKLKPASVVDVPDHYGGKPWKRELKDDVELKYRREDDGTYTVKIQGIISEPIFRTISIINETDISDNWVPFLTNANKLFQFGRAAQLIHHCYKMPWPLGTRDVVMKGVGVDMLDDEMNCLLLMCSSPEESQKQVWGYDVPPPAKGSVRVPVNQLCFLLHPTDDGKKTVMQILTNVEPGLRAIPQRIVQYILKTFVKVIYDKILKLSQTFESTEYTNRVKKNPDLYGFLATRLDEYEKKLTSSSSRRKSKEENKISNRRSSKDENKISNRRSSINEEKKNDIPRKKSEDKNSNINNVSHRRKSLNEEKNNVIKKKSKETIITPVKNNSGKSPPSAATTADSGYKHKNESSHRNQASTESIKNKINKNKDSVPPHLPVF